MHRTAFVFIALLPLAAGAATADFQAAKARHDKACAACHAGIVGGDGSQMYTRDQRIVANAAELRQRVAFCAAQAKAGWKPAEEAEVAAWLNRQYYHFQP